MAEIKGTKTEQNLNAAFAGESQARVKYQFYASKAKKEGYEQISAIFQETSDNEKEHAKIWYKLLHDGVADTMTNLKDAAAGENYEYTDMYKKFAEKGMVFKGDGVTVWKCRNCGYIHIGDSAPEKCPVCDHPQSYFEIQAVNY